MPCPKCAFPAEAGATACPRCGVVFSKLPGRKAREARASRPAPPARPPPPKAPAPAPLERGRSFSVTNVILLSIVLCASGVLYLQSRSRDEGPEPALPSLPKAEEGGNPAREILVEVPSPSSSGTLVIPGLSLPPAQGSESEPSPPAARELPKLPELNENTVGPALIEQAKRVAAEFPDDPSIRQYLFQAHLLLAGKAIAVRRFEEALSRLDEAERWSADPSQTAVMRAVIYSELPSWELAEKWARTALAYGARDNTAEMHHILGKAYYFREDMEKAIAEFRTALALEEDPAIRSSLEQAMLESRTARGFDQKRLSHFIVSYEGETMESTGRMVLDALERSRANLISRLGYEPQEPVVVILYSQRSYREMGGPHWSAGYFDGKIRMPVGGLYQVDAQIRSTLQHELVHAFIHARAGEAAPRWLHEGVAQYLDGTRAADGGQLLSKVLARGDSFEHCLPTAQCDVQIFYSAAVSLVDYLVQMRGVGGVRDLLATLGEGEDIDGSLQRVLGKDEAGLIREWEHFVSRRYSAGGESR